MKSKINVKVKEKVKLSRYRPQQALGGSGRHPYAPAVFTPGVSWYSFLEAEPTPGHMVPSVAKEKKSPATSLRIDAETLRLVAQRLNHYAIPGPEINVVRLILKYPSLTAKKIFYS
jgi:hypothetical protein